MLQRVAVSFSAEFPLLGDTSPFPSSAMSVGVAQKLSVSPKPVSPRAGSKEKRGGAVRWAARQTGGGAKEGFRLGRPARLMLSRATAASGQSRRDLCAHYGGRHGESKAIPRFHAPYIVRFSLIPPMEGAMTACTQARLPIAHHKACIKWFGALYIGHEVEPCQKLSSRPCRPGDHDPGRRHLHGQAVARHIRTDDGGTRAGRAQHDHAA
jgi:hypothetical protein